MEVCKSQAQIAWHTCEELSAQLKTMQSELDKSKAAFDQEERQFRLHRRGNNELLLRMNTGSSKIVDTLVSLGMKNPHILKPDHSSSLGHYPTFLDHVALLVRGAKESASKVTCRAGEKAVWKVATQFIATLLQRGPQPSFLSELERVTPGMSSDPEVIRQVDEIMKRLSREDDQ